MVRRSAIVVALLAGAGRLPGQEVDGAFGLPTGDRVVPAPPERVEGGKGAGAEAFANGGFEMLVGGHPAQWSVGGGATTGLDGADRFARIGSSHFYSQAIAVPFAHRHATLSARFRTEIFGFPAFDVFGAGPDEVVYQRAAWSLPEEAGWARLFGTFMFVEPAAAMTVVPRTTSGASWVDMDDIVVFDEGIAGGDFEGTADGESFPAWTLAGGAAVVADGTMQAGGASALRLPAGGSATIVAGARDAGQSYFVAGRARGEGDAATLRVRLRDANPLVDAADHFAQEVAVGAAAAPFVVETGRTPSACRAERVAFEHAGGAALVVDVASRGFVHVWPPTYWSGADSVNPDLSLVAAWPGELATATVAIRNAQDAVVETVPLVVAQGTATGAWSGAGHPAGFYEAEFSLAGESGAAAVLARPFEHRAESGAVAEAPAFVAERFERGAWIWLFATPPTEEALRPIFAQAAEDGFTFAAVFASVDHWPAVRAVCEEIGLRFMASSIQSNSFVRGNPPGISPPDFSTYAELVPEELAALAGSPMAMGTYIVDEPISVWEQRNAGAAVRCAAAFPALGTPFLTVTPASAADPAAWDRIRPPVHWTDFYPFHDAEPDFAARLRLLSDHLREQVGEAKARDRAYWLVAQAFSSVDGPAMGNDATVRATMGLCVAHGVRGIVPFFYIQANALEGMRLPDLSPLPETDAWVAGNHRIATVEEELVEHVDHAVVAPNLETFVATTARDGANALLLCAVNLECRRAARLSIEFDGQEAILTEITTGETLSTANGTIEVPFAPGDWRLWRVGGAMPVAFAESVDPAAPPVLNLTVYADTKVPAGVVHDLEFSPNGGSLLVASGGAVYRLFATGEILNAFPALGATSVAWLSGNTALYVAPTIGMQGMQFPSGATTDSWIRRVGTASWAVAAPGGAVWTGSDLLGARRLASTGTLTYASSHVGAPSGFLRRGIGTFADGSVLAPELFGGFRRGVANAQGGIDFSSVPGPAMTSGGSLSFGRTVAASARMRRGFSLTRFDAAGNAVAFADHPPPTGESVVVVEMMADDMLAVGEFDGDVSFYGVNADLSLAARGRWSPDPRPTKALAAMDHIGGVFAQGYGDGRVILFDASTLPAGYPPSDLFEVR